MMLDRKSSDIPEIGSSSYLADREPGPANIFHETQLASPPTMLNISSFNSEIHSGDGVRFGEEIYILARRRDGETKEPILYEATKEFRDFLRTRSDSPDKSHHQEQDGVSCTGNLSNNDTHGLWRPRNIEVKRMIYGVIYSTIVCGIIVLCNILFYKGDKFSESWYVERSSWKARTRTCPIADLKLPTRLLIISHTSGHNCKDLDDCSEKVKDAQAWHINGRRLCDIKYSFIVGGDSRVYEGRMFKQRENISDAYFDRALMIAFLGDYNRDTPSREQIERLRAFIGVTLNAGHIDPGYKIAALDPMSPTGSPGFNIRSVISQWKEWTEHPEEVFDT